MSYQTHHGPTSSNPNPSRSLPQADTNPYSGSSIQGASVVLTYKGLETSFRPTLSWNNTAAVRTLANKQDRAFEDDAGAIKYGAPLVYQGPPTC